MSEIGFPKDSTFRHTLIMKNQHIVTHYFDTRLLNYMCSVGVELFDFCDYWFRYEFAAGRGMIHSHGVIFSLSHAKKIREALEIFLGDSQGSISSNVATELEKVLQNADYNSETFFCPEFVSMHPAGGETIIDCNGNPEWNAHKSKWAHPEGTAGPPCDNPLATNLDCVLHLKHGIQKLHIDV